MLVADFDSDHSSDDDDGDDGDKHDNDGYSHGT